MPTSTKFIDKPLLYFSFHPRQKKKKKKKKIIIQTYKAQRLFYNSKNTSCWINLFSRRYEFDFKMIIYNVHRRNFKGEGAKETINISTTW